MLEAYASELLEEMSAGRVFEQLKPNEQFSYELLQKILSATTKLDGISCREHVNMIVDLALTDAKQMEAFTSQYGTQELREAVKSISSLDRLQLENILWLLREQFRKYLKPPLQAA